MRCHWTIFPATAEPPRAQCHFKLQSPLLLAPRRFYQVGVSPAWSTPRSGSGRGVVGQASRSAPIGSGPM
jgi:hypothetical protein